MTNPNNITLIRNALAEVVPERTNDWSTVELSATIESLGLDSIQTMEMVSAIEDATGKTFSDEDLPKINTLGDLSSALDRAS